VIADLMHFHEGIAIFGSVSKFARRILRRSWSCRFFSPILGTARAEHVAQAEAHEAAEVGQRQQGRPVPSVNLSLPSLAIFFARRLSCRRSI
jgi:hypothetical protein